MSELKNANPYHFLINDPDLSTSANNFQFKYNRQDLIENAIQKVQQRRRPDSPTPCSDFLWNKYKQRREQAVDSERRVGLLRQPNQFEDIQINTFSNTSLDSIKAVHGDNERLEFCVTKDDNDENDMYVLCSEQFEDLDETLTVFPAKKSQIIDSSLTEDYRLQQPKWVEVIARSAPEPRIEMEYLNYNKISDRSEADGDFTGLMNEILAAKKASQQNYQSAVIPNEAAGGDYAGQLKQYTNIYEDGNMLNLSDNMVYVPEIEVDIMTDHDVIILNDGGSLSFGEIISSNTNRSSKQPTEFADDVNFSNSQDSNQIVRIKRKSKPSIQQLACERLYADSLNRSPTGRSPSSRTTTTTNRTVKPSTTVSTLLLSSTPPTAIRCATDELSSSGRCQKSRKVRKSRPKIQQLEISKSIEDLKMEKFKLYRKMSSAQRKLIEMMDELRMHLMELTIPENPFEVSKRQKNAFEFAVRFSRNFLYPLKGMIEDLKFTPFENFNSLTTNDATKKVSVMFGLLQQSLGTYQKQLRYFLLEHVPQKLMILIEMILTAVTICLEKCIFDKQDVIVDALQNRCLDFLKFLEEFPLDGRERAAAAAANDRLKSHCKLTRDKAYNKYDLKMFMNDLNMYEPKIVPKDPISVGKHKQKIYAKRDNIVVTTKESITYTKKPLEDHISTQIQNFQEEKTECVHESVSLVILDKLADCSVFQDQNFIELLKSVSEEQLREILIPVVDKLDLNLPTKHDTEQVIEAIVNVYKAKVDSTAAVESGSKSADDSDQSTGEKKKHSQRTLCEPPKAAKQTKLLQQQNISETNSQRTATTLTPTPTAAATAKAKHLLLAEAAAATHTQKNNSVKTKTKISNNNKRSNNASVVAGTDAGNNNDIYDNNNKHENTQSTATKCNATKLSESTKQVIETKTEEDAEIMNTLVTDDQIQKQMSINRYAKNMLCGENDNDDNQDNDKDDGDSEYDYEVNSQCDLHSARQNQMMEHPTTEDNISNCNINLRKANLSGQMKRDRDNGAGDKAISCESILRYNADLNAEEYYSASEMIKDKYESSRENLITDSKPNRFIKYSQQHCSQTNQTAIDHTHLPSSGCSPPYGLQHYSNKMSKTKAKINSIKQKAYAKHLRHQHSPTAAHYANNEQNMSESDNEENEKRAANKELCSMPMEAQTFSQSHANSHYDDDFDDDYNEENDDDDDDNEENVVDYEEYSNCHITHIEQQGFTNSNAASQKITQHANFDRDNITSQTKSNPPLIINESAETEMGKKKKSRHPLTNNNNNNENDLQFRENFTINAYPPNATSSTINTEELLKSRDYFLKLCSKNRYYSNPNYSKPWKVFSKISEKLVAELLQDVENEFSSGVSKFVGDFLKLETKSWQ